MGQARRHVGADELSCSARRLAPSYLSGPKTPAPIAIGISHVRSIEVGAMVGAHGRFSADLESVQGGFGVRGERQLLGNLHCIERGAF